MALVGLRRTMLVAALVVGCSGGGDQTRVFRRAAIRTGTVSGVVVDADTGLPIANALVELPAGRRVQTRIDGSFEAELPAGRARVRVSSQDHLLGAREVAVDGL